MYNNAYLTCEKKKNKQTNIFSHVFTTLYVWKWSCKKLENKFIKNDFFFKNTYIKKIINKKIKKIKLII